MHVKVWIGVGCLPQSLFTLFSETKSQGTWSSLILLAGLVSELQGSVCPPPPQCWHYRCAAMFGFHVGVGDLNSGPHV